MLNYLTVSFSILSLSIWAFLSTIGAQKSPNKVEVTVLTPLPINSTHIAEADSKKLPKSPQLKKQVDSSLQFALNIAQKHIAKNKFLKRIKYSKPNIEYQIHISRDYYFSKNESHLIIRRVNQQEILIDVFVKAGNDFKKVLSLQEEVLEYVSDTIQDIDDDGFKDYVIRTYSCCGCCLRAVSKVYLQKTQGSFVVNPYKFMNPTFSPKEKIIRGICYGQAGDTEMYKYKWRGRQIDTLEFIAYQKRPNGERTGKFLILRSRKSETNQNILKVINKVPKEYLRIVGYDWFTGKI